MSELEDIARETICNESEREEIMFLNMKKPSLSCGTTSDGLIGMQLVSPKGEKSTEIGRHNNKKKMFFFSNGCDTKYKLEYILGH